VNDGYADSIKEENRANRHRLDSINAVTIERMQVNYNFASARIRKADYPQLTKVIQMMAKNPALNILVASFTDCIGSKSNNALLSRKRSESVKAYLINKGISPSRINIDFFGKMHFVMACREDSSYNKEKQIANRRSDLIVTLEKNPKWQPSGKELDIRKKEDNSSAKPFGNNTAGISNDNHKPQTAYAGMAGQRNGTNTVNNKYSANTARNEQPIQSKDKNKQTENTTMAGERKGVDTANNTYSGNTTRKEPNTQARDKQRKNTVVETKGKPGAIKNQKQPSAPTFVKAQTETYVKADTDRAVDSMRKTMKITELLDRTPHLKKPGIIEEMTRRTPRKSFEIRSTSDSVRVDLYDNGVFDYDSVSVIYNKELVAYKQVLRTNKPVSFYVKLDFDPRKNEMIFFAENLGLTPPNSALMIITDGDNKRTEVNVSSDLEHNAVIYFIKVKK